MKFFLLGAANPETIRMIRAIRSRDPNFIVGGMLDNDISKQGAGFFGIPVVGGLEKVGELASESTRFVNLITGSTRERHETTSRILASGGALGNFIHPSIDLHMVRIGVGHYIQEGVVIQADVSLGDNTSIHTSAIVAHESTVGKSVFIAHAVSISGCCSIGDGTFIGTNASILPRVKIGRWVTVGAGAVVTKDIPDYAVVVGNPARVLRIEPSEKKV